MSLLKSALRTDIVRRGLCVLAALYIGVVRAASRWRVEGGDIPEAFWRQGKPFIGTFWHGRLLMMPYCWPRNVPMNLLISGHPDGQLISGAIGYFGFGVIVGSTQILLEPDRALLRRGRIRTALGTVAAVLFVIVGGFANFVWVNGSPAFLSSEPLREVAQDGAPTEGATLAGDAAAGG